MEQKDRELMIQDLCARLPYGVFVETKENGYNWGGVLKVYCNGKFGLNLNRPYDVSEIKPYLRRESSMTEEEKEECVEMGIGYWDSGHYEDDEHSFLYGGKTFQLIPCSDAYDYCNRNHIDYRGMIDRGLALEATEDMYKH